MQTLAMFLGSVRSVFLVKTKKRLMFYPTFIFSVVRPLYTGINYKSNVKMNFEDFIVVLLTHRMRFIVGISGKPCHLY